MIPGVTIEACNIATNDVSRTTTNESGYYAFPVLPIGTYRLTAAPAGFKKAVRDNLELRVGDQVQQDFTLEVGAVTESVTVSAGVELLQTTGSDKGQVVGEKEVQDTPSVGRNPFLLGIEATGVQFDIGANALSRSVRPFDAGNNVAESMSINGGQTGRSDLLLDGLSDTGVETGSSATNMAFVPNQDAVQEFRIQNSNYDAQYGRTSGGTISLITKGHQPRSWRGLLVQQEHRSHGEYLRPEPPRQRARSLSPERARRRARRAGGDSPPLRRPQQDFLHVLLRAVA